LLFGIDSSAVVTATHLNFGTIH